MSTYYDPDDDTMTQEDRCERLHELADHMRDLAKDRFLDDFNLPSGGSEKPPVAMLPAEPSHTFTGEWDGEAAGGYVLTDTEETIRPNTPEEDAGYKAEGKEIEQDAIAILATSDKFLTGYETQVCERAAGFHNGMHAVDMGVFNSLRTEFSREIANFKNQ